MALVDYDDQLAVDLNGVPIPGAVVHAYAPEDLSHTTPIPLYDANGISIPQLQANNQGRIPPYKVDTLMEVTLVSGEFVKTVGSYKAIKAFALAAQTAAQAAQAAAEA